MKILGLKYFYLACGKTLLIIAAVDKDGKRVEIHLDKEIKVLYKKSGFTWIAKKPFKINSIEEIHNYCKDIPLHFKQTPRHMLKRPVWIFIGLFFLVSPILESLSLSIFYISKNLFTGRIIEDIIYAGLDDYSSICIEDYLYISVFFSEYRIISESSQFIYVFTGDSNKGKSYISSNTNLSIYETDKCESLPNVFLCNIIVVGKKYPFDIEMISKIIDKNMNIIHVNFV
jgi:hypothetical protein